jgi:hypothetical protein
MNVTRRMQIRAQGIEQGGVLVSNLLAASAVVMQHCA